MLMFVYGSLMKGFPNHYLLEKAEFITTAKIKGLLYSLPYGYPALVDGDEWAFGEVYNVDDETLKAVDNLEGYNEDGINNLYDRIKADAAFENGAIAKVFIYKYCNRDEVEEIGTLVHSGDWRNCI